MHTRKIIIVDAIINLFLGVLLLLSIVFPDQLSRILGVPSLKPAFYPSIMGGVFVGINIALWTQKPKKTASSINGLGFSGAIAINLCGGAVFLGWLVFGILNLPLQGWILLWCTSLILIILSSLELISLINLKISKLMWKSHERF